MAIDLKEYVPALKYGGQIDADQLTDADIANADISSSAAIAYSKLDLATSILNADISTSAAITREKLSAPSYRKAINVLSATIGTTGDADIYVIAPETGTLASADFSCVDALAASDTNYLTFSITNLGQAGAGSTAMLAATDANTTKSTGGAAASANTLRSLTVHGTAANLNVTTGDRLRIRAAATGTLANTVTFPTYLLRFSGTT